MANAEQSQEVTNQHAAYGVSCRDRMALHITFFSKGSGLWGVSYRDIMALHITFLLETMQLCTYKNLDYVKL